MVDASVLQRAPRVIATQEERVLMASGDRAYVRGDAATPLTIEPGEPRQFRVFRDAVAMKDPLSGEILGYEAQYLGKAELLRLAVDRALDALEAVTEEPGATTGGFSRPKAAEVMPTRSSTEQASPPLTRFTTPDEDVSSRCTSASAT